MKSYRIDINDALSNSNIEKAFRHASKGKTNRPDVKSTLNNLENEIKYVYEILMNNEYNPRKHMAFDIRDSSHGKQRKIIKPDYKYEQVVHHILVQSVKDGILHGMYEHNLGSIPNRGCHLGKKRIEKWLKTDKKNTKYVLKMDIHHFFGSIDHKILLNRLCKKYRDKWLQELFKIIINATDDGLPLGFYTSQWFANFLLQDLDYYIKQELKVKYMVRYMDDIVCFGNNKKKLHEARRCIAEYLQTNYNLKLKSNWQVFRFSFEDKDGNLRGRPLDYMGFIFYRNKTLLRKHILIRATRKAKRIKKQKRINPKDAMSMLSYMGYFTHTDTYNAYLKRVKPYINVRQLKKVVRKDTRRKNELEKSKRNRGSKTSCS